MAVVIPLNNPGGPEGDTVTVDEQLLNTEYWKLTHWQVLNSVGSVLVHQETADWGGV
jgi:hypothetical protein